MKSACVNLCDLHIIVRLKDLQCNSRIRSVLGLVAVEHTLKRLDINPLVLLNFFCGRVLDSGKLNSTAEDCDEIHVSTWHQRAILAAEIDSAWDFPLVELEAELLQVRKRMERLLFSERESRIDLRHARG